MHQGSMAPTGRLGLVKRSSERRASFTWRLKNFPHYWRGAWRAYLAIAIAKITHLPVMIGSLDLRVLHADGSITNYGRVGLRVVTTAGVNYIVDCFQGTAEMENLKFHGFGVGGAAEAIGNTALTTELTTEYATDNTRPTGTTVEGASANIARTVATLDPDSAVAITEHGIFSATSAGTLLDRTLFAAVNLAATGDTLEATYELTFTAGS